MKSLYITEQSGELNIIKNLYHRAFPKNERIPFWFLLWRARRNNIDFIAIFDNEVFIGFTYLIHNKDITFVLYLAICESFRSKGYGSKILELLKCRAPCNRIILCIESPYVKSGNQHQREKREVFYLRNGFLQAHLNVLECGETYEVLTSNGEIKMKEYLNLLKSFIGRFLYTFFKPKLILQ
jgi:GNAT superfamily N-acetyltransferase